MSVRPEIHEVFINELQQLCREYDAGLIIENHWTGYAECGSDNRITVEFSDSKIPDLDLGSFINCDKHGAM